MKDFKNANNFLYHIRSKKAILWDFDGVIIDSEKIRTYGFEKTLEDYPNDEVEQLITYHKRNGGISRYVKYQYFFEEIRNEEVKEKRIRELAERFSEIMLDQLTDKKVLIEETVAFIKDYRNSFHMHIVSGSDGEELRSLCRSLEIDHLFHSINGSPTPKIDLVKQLLNSQKLQSQECILIGDSINDFEAAENSQVEFFAYNNQDLKSQGFDYIDSFKIE